MTDAQIHAREKEFNFRWIESISGTTSSRVLTDADLVPDDIVARLASVGEFAEIAHGSIDPAFVLTPENRRALTRPGFPLEGYATLADTTNEIRCTRVFHGDIGRHQGFVALLPARNEVVLAFSGTANPTIAQHLLRAWKIRYHHSAAPKACTVHAGFQQIYLAGIRDASRSALANAFAQLKRDNNAVGDIGLIITGHSLGGVLAHLALVDLLHDIVDEPHSTEWPWQRSPPRITLAAFGAPRAGNDAFAAHYAALVAAYRSRNTLDDWSVYGYRDGVPSLPPFSAPLCARPFYLYHGDLYAIPESERTHTRFRVERDESRPRRFEQGGHNYYNVRDMEGLQRRMRSIQDDAAKGYSIGECIRRYLAREAR